MDRAVPGRLKADLKKEKLQKWSYLMCSAAYAEDFKTFKQTASDYPGSDSPHWDWDAFIFIASEGKNEEKCLEIIKYSCKLLNELNYHLPNIKSCVLKAVTAGNSDIAKFLASKGDNEWNLFMRAAAYVGDLDLAEHFRWKGGDDYSGCVANAALGGHLNIIFQYSAKDRIDWDECANNAAFNGHVDVFKFATQKSIRRERYGKTYSMNWQRYAVMAALGGNVDILILMDGKGIDWDTCLRLVGDRKIENKDEIFKFMGGNVFED